MATDFWFKFNFKDWANDVRPLSLTARGLLLEMIIYMRQAPVVGQMPNDIRFIVRLTGGLTEEITESITEFKNFGILDFVKNDDGTETIISRRIVKEFERSRINAENGKNGGNPKLKKEIRLTESVNQNSNQTHNRTSNSIFNSNSEDDFIEKGVQGEKQITAEMLAKIPEKVHEFADRALMDLSLLQSCQNKNSKITEHEYVKLVEEFRNVQIHGTDYYHVYQGFKRHLLNSSLLKNWDTTKGNAKTKSGQALTRNLASEIKYDQNGNAIL